MTKPGVLTMTTISRRCAIEIAKGGNFDGCEIHDLEEIVRITGSKKAVAELQRRINAYGPLVKDERGNLIRR